MNDPIRKLITRSFSCHTMRERFEKLGATKVGDVPGGCNIISSTYKGTYGGGINYEVIFEFTRNMGDFTYLVLDSHDFTSMAALERFYRDLKHKTTNLRYGEQMNKYTFTYVCRHTNSVSIYIEAECRKDADIFAEDKLRQVEDLGISMPGLRSFECISQRKLNR